MNQLKTWWVTSEIAYGLRVGVEMIAGLLFLMCVTVAVLLTMLITVGVATLAFTYVYRGFMYFLE